MGETKNDERGELMRRLEDL